MALNSLHCAEVPLSNCSLTPIAAAVVGQHCNSLRQKVSK